MRKIKKKKLNPNQKITLKRREIEKLKQKATLQAVRVTNYFPLFILRDKYGFGEKRLKEFQEHYLELWDHYNNNRLNLKDIADTLEDEVNITWDEVTNDIENK